MKNEMPTIRNEDEMFFTRLGENEDIEVVEMDVNETVNYNFKDLKTVFLIVNTILNHFPYQLF